MRKLALLYLMPACGALVATSACSGNRYPTLDLDGYGLRFASILPARDVPR